MFLRVVNNILKILFLLPLRYFTSWILMFHILYHLNIFKKYQYSLLVLSLLVSSIGGFITYVYPKKLNILYLDISIEGTGLKIFDLIFHHLPLILLLYRYNSHITKDNLIVALIIIIVYLLINDPFKVYNIKFCKTT